MSTHFPTRICMAALLALTVHTAHAGEFDCLLEPRETVELRSPTTGLIERINADRGQFVKAGQVVIELDAAQERVSLDMARHKATMQGPLKSGESRLAFATVKFTRRENLAKENFLSIQDKDEADTERHLAESELQDAKDNRRSAEIEVKRTEEQIRVRQIKSPISGVVTERNMHAGELADPAEGKKPILRIADIATLRAEVILPAQAYAYVKVGQKATIRADVPTKVNTSGVVKVVDRVLDAASGTFSVRLEVLNPNLQIPAGIHCKADFPEVPAAISPARRSGGKATM